MGVSARMLALVWLCWAGRLCDGLEASTDDHFDYKFDSSYIAMKKAANGISILNPDMLVIYGLEAAGLYYAATHGLSYLAYQKLSSNTTKMYAAALNGKCITLEQGDHGKCVTERDFRVMMIKEARMALQDTATLITEAGVRARLQWFIENGVDDVVSILSTSAQNVIRDLFFTFIGPLQNLWTRIDKFQSILVDRYSSGTGGTDKLMWTADGVASEVYAIIGAIISKQYRVAKFYYSTEERVGQFCVMFRDHLEAVSNLPVANMHQGSPLPFIDRYWDARALEYAVTWIFKMRKEVRDADKKEFDKVLADLYDKLVAGENEEALELANHFLSKSMDMLGPKVFSKYLEQSMHNEILRLSVPLPPNLEDINPSGVPKSQHEFKVSLIENTIHHFLDEAAEDSVGRLLFNHIVSVTGDEMPQ